MKPTYVVMMALGLLWWACATFMLLRFILAGNMPALW